MASVVPQAGRRLLITVNRVWISGSPVSLHWNHQTGRDESLITAPMWLPLTLGGSSLHMPGCWWRFWPSTKPPLTQTQGGGGHLIIARWEWSLGSHGLPWHHGWALLTPWRWKSQLPTWPSQTPAWCWEGGFGISAWPDESGGLGPTSAFTGVDVARPPFLL